MDCSCRRSLAGGHVIRWTKQLSLYGLEVDPLLLARVRADRVCGKEVDRSENLCSGWGEPGPARVLLTARYRPALLPCLLCLTSSRC